MAKTALLLTLLLLSMITADIALSVACAESAWPELPRVLYGALLSSQAAVLGVWIALARRPLALRLLAGLAVLCLFSALWLGIEWLQFLSLQAGVVAMLVTGVRWWFGFALGHVEDDHPTAERGNGWQVSILDLLVLMTIASVSLGVMRFQPIERATLLAWLGYQIPLAAITCGATGFVLARRFDSAGPYQMFALALLVACTPIGSTELWPWPESVQSQAALLQLLIGIGLMLGSTWTFRAAGYRIAWLAQAHYEAGGAAAGCAAAAGCGGAAGGGVSAG